MQTPSTSGDPAAVVVDDVDELGVDRVTMTSTRSSSGGSETVVLSLEVGPGPVLRQESGSRPSDASETVVGSRMWFLCLVRCLRPRGAETDIIHLTIMLFFFFKQVQPCDSSFDARSHPVLENRATGENM